LIFQFSIFSRVGVSALIAVVVVWSASVDLCARDQSRGWIVLKDCRLIPNPANDGDSFHVSAGEKEYLFRLYLVDAPETDEMTPRRLIDQAKYFNITVPQAIEVGRVAKDFTQEKLSQPFTVFTHMSDAMGQSRLERFYAFVETKEGDLAEQLVRNGLARCYGFKAAPPGLTSSRIELERLRQFEDQAKRDKIGAWGVNAGRLKVRPQTPNDFSSFVPEEKSRSRAARPDSSTVVSSIPQPDAPNSGVPLVPHHLRACLRTQKFSKLLAFEDGHTITGFETDSRDWADTGHILSFGLYDQSCRCLFAAVKR
jgi:endonuclease YncB( thermonuclease family)